MPTLPIVKGGPFVWQQVVDNVTAYWPEFAAELPGSDSKGSPIKANLLAIMAMMIPPNTAARPGDIDGLNQSGIPQSGAANEFLNQGMFVAADVFYFVVSGQFVTFFEAQGDCNDNLPALDVDGSLPGLPLFIGLVYTEYTDGDTFICTASVAARSPS